MSEEHNQQLDCEAFYLNAVRSTKSWQGEIENALFAFSFEEISNLEKSGLHAVCSVTNLLKSRRLASLCITEKGALDLEVIKQAKEILEKHLFHLGPGLEEDRRRDLHIKNALSFLLESQKAQRLIQKMSRPIVNRLAENAVRDTLILSEDQPINDSHVRKAALVALFTSLRQSLGSCFATAPAIVVQEEFPLLFLQDIDELMGTARLTRTVEGNEYSVPLSASWGQGDLKKPLVLTLPLEKSLNPCWLSPILINILLSLKVISNASQLQPLIEKVLGKRLSRKKWLVTDIEEVFKLLFLSHLSISEKDLEEYLLRPKAMMQTAAVAAYPVARAEDKEIKRFFELWERAKRRYKAGADCALLKSWEYTVASFSEVKFDFCRWNFYSSLGLNWDDAGGIGNLLYTIGTQRVEQTNQEIQEYKEKYEAISIEVDYLSRRLQQASTESEIRWIKIEHQSKQAEQYHIQQLYEMAVEKTNKITHLHQFLIDQYDSMLKEYFQEIYDADLHDVQTGRFDDSPAGFRLLYKHGRTNPSLWSKIFSLEEYIEALVSFFTITEQELLHHSEVQGIEAEFSSIITLLANHVRSEEFMESAFYRTAVAHGVRPIDKPLLNLDKIEKKPWVYTSGGSMKTLVSSYFCLHDKIEVQERWVENETELLAFYIDSVRLSLKKETLYTPSYLLSHSPTHAFLLCPHHFSFKESWDSDVYSYTWIRNALVDPALSFYSSCVLDKEAVESFCSMIGNSLPEEITNRFLNESSTISGFLRPYELAREIEKLFSIDAVLHPYQRVLQELCIEKLLFESVPYISPEDLHKTVFDIIKEALPEYAHKINIESIRAQLPSFHMPLKSSELLSLLKGYVISLTGAYRFSQDVFEKIVQEMRKQRRLPPQPIIVADSNWVKELFAFVVSPVSQQIEFWSVNAYGTKGAPISHWKRWLDGSQKGKTWGIFNNPIQYTH